MLYMHQKTNLKVANPPTSFWDRVALHFLYKNNFIRIRGHFCSKFRTS